MYDNRHDRVHKVRHYHFLGWVDYQHPMAASLFDFRYLVDTLTHEIMANHVHL